MKFLLKIQFCHYKTLSLHRIFNYSILYNIDIMLQTDLYNSFSKPVYVLEEQLLRRNLSLIKSVADRAGVEIILAFKAFALWKTFPIFREYINSTTASSLSEARLAMEEFGAPAHTYSPAFTDYEIDEISKCSSHLTFNSLSQYQRYVERVVAVNPHISLGLRVNPEYSEIETDLYNPCAPGSRFGVIASDLPSDLPDGIDGFHCHCHCESGSEEFVRTLRHFESKFSKWLDKLKWVNFGGGHLMTRKDYDVDLLIETLLSFRSRYPNLKVILEPGSAFAWQTGVLVAQVVDVVQNAGIKTAILNVSFTCHMPDCLEMPYHPVVRGADLVGENTIGHTKLDTSFIYRLGGNSCLSGDFMGCWKFDHELKVGECLIFEDMIHYTTVKTNVFNGVSHPSLAILHGNSELEILRDFGYQDYKNRMD